MIVFVNCYEENAVGMRILAAMTKEHGFDVHLFIFHGYKVCRHADVDPESKNLHIAISGRFQRNQDKDTPVTSFEISLFLKKLHKMQPKMLCFSARSKNDAVICGMIQEVRKHFPSLPIVCGGYGPTYTPLSYLESGATLVVRGEGEDAMLQILKCLGGSRHFHSVTNACYLDGNTMICNPLATPLRSFENLPRPLTGDQYVSFIENDIMQERDPAFDDSTFNLLLGRGCVGSCSYCAAPGLRNLYQSQGAFMPRYRKGHLDSSFRDMADAKNYGVTRIRFKDEYLTLPPNEIISLFQRYQNEITLPFAANFHHQHLLFNEELRKTVINAGLSVYAIGFQAGYEAMAREVYNRPHKFDEFTQLAHILFHEFVSIQYHFVSGTSLNTEDEFRKKLQLIKQLPFDPVMPDRTLLFDFQFNPNQGTVMTKALAQGGLKQKSTLEWAMYAILCQLRIVADDTDFDIFLSSASPTQGYIKKMQEIYWVLLEEKKKTYYESMDRELSEKPCIIVTTAEGLSEDIVPRIKMPVMATYKVPRDCEGISRAVQNMHTDGVDRDTPILLCRPPLLESARLLRRQFGLSNPIYPIKRLTAGQ